MKHEEIGRDLQCLDLLLLSLPTTAEVGTEIINLQIILHLPKETKHFMVGIREGDEAFQYVLKSALGDIKHRVDELSDNSPRENGECELCTLIHYPEQELGLVKVTEKDVYDWHHVMLYQLMKVYKDISNKYTCSEVRKALPKGFGYIIQELLHGDSQEDDKIAYCKVIIKTITSTGRTGDFIIASANVIRQLVIDQLCIPGDAYGQGPGIHIALDFIERCHNWGIQQGSHDITWMGANARNNACICSVIRLSLRYVNLVTLEEGYGINLASLVIFTIEICGDDPCKEFHPRPTGGLKEVDGKTLHLAALMRKAIAIVRFKEESKLFEKHPEWRIQNRALFNNTDYEKGTILLGRKEYPLRGNNFSTIGPKHPSELTPEEQDLMNRLNHSFIVSEKLHERIRLLLQHGCIYDVYNGNLLFYASTSLSEDGSLEEIEIYPGRKYADKELVHSTDMMIHTTFQNGICKEEHEYVIDYFTCLWCRPNSSLLNKSEVSTFERHFVTDEGTRHEEKDNYLRLRGQETIAGRILDTFDVAGENRHIINGHISVYVTKGGNPIKVNGRLITIDGGFSQIYHKEAGTTDYALAYHGRSLQLVQHESFTSANDAILQGTDIVNTTQIVEMSSHRMLVSDADKGAETKQQIKDLEALLYTYRHGFLKGRDRQIRK